MSQRMATVIHLRKFTHFYTLNGFFEFENTILAQNTRDKDDFYSNYVVFAQKSIEV